MGDREEGWQAHSRGRRKGGHWRGRGRGRSRSRGGFHRRERSPAREALEGAQEDLSNVLLRIDRSQYGAYKQLARSRWTFSEGFVLCIESVQSDPFAPASRLSVVVSGEVAQFPKWTTESKVRRIALADFLTRRFLYYAQALDKQQYQTTDGSKFHDAKGGDIRIDPPTQHVLERTAVIVSEGAREIEARFTMCLPARGRTIAGRVAERALISVLPGVVKGALTFESISESALKDFILAVEDQEVLRAKLKEEKLVAFIANGSILPRESGVSDKPMDASKAVPFKSPPSMEKTIELPNAGKVTGMGIREGVTLIIGGGYNGKSTMLDAIENGVYNQIPGDGRELVVCTANAMKLRGEDGRSISNVDISPFINDLPMGKSTKDFSTENASGSTSQAANLMEAVEAGTDTLLIDEDSCCTNFMYRDGLMAQVVPQTKEPITVFLCRIREIFDRKGISTVIALGSCGEYFHVADTVICMDGYKPTDCTERAHHLVKDMDNPWVPLSEASFQMHRFPKSQSFTPTGRTPKTVARRLQTVQYGEVDVDVGLVEQIVEVSQLRASLSVIEYMRANGLLSGELSLKEVLDQVEEIIDSKGLAAIASNRPGNLSRPRSLEIAALINRIPHVQFKV